MGETLALTLLIDPSTSPSAEPTQRATASQRVRSSQPHPHPPYDYLCMPPVRTQSGALSTQIAVIPSPKSCTSLCTPVAINYTRKSGKGWICTRWFCFRRSIDFSIPKHSPLQTLPSDDSLSSGLGAGLQYNLLVHRPIPFANTL